MSPVLVDSNVLVDIIGERSEWTDWSEAALHRLMAETTVVINALIFAEASVALDSFEALEAALPETLYKRAELPYEAAFAAGKAFAEYRRRGGARTSPLPDFYIGAHALISGFELLTRDTRRYRTYFPDVRLIAPDT